LNYNRQKKTNKRRTGAISFPLAQLPGQQQQQSPAGAHRSRRRVAAFVFFSAFCFFLAHSLNFRRRDHNCKKQLPKFSHRILTVNNSKVSSVSIVI